MRIRIQDAQAAVKAFREAVRGNVVPDDEILRRVEVCKACPKRRLNQGFPTRVSQVLGALSSKYRVHPDMRDYSCGVCGCSLLLLLPATAENLHRDSEAERAARPAKCWLKLSP